MISFFNRASRYSHASQYFLPFILSWHKTKLPNVVSSAIHLKNRDAWLKKSRLTRKWNLPFYNPQFRPRDLLILRSYSVSLGPYFNSSFIFLKAGPRRNEAFVKGLKTVKSVINYSTKLSSYRQKGWLFGCADRWGILIFWFRFLIGFLDVGRHHRFSCLSFCLDTKRNKKVKAHKKMKSAFL
jgi:hypothetical protein